MGNISNLKITSRARDFFNILVDVEVKNVKHLSEITVALRAMPTINSVSRIRGKEQ
jgi:GTP pyrophosphokinase